MYTDNRNHLLSPSLRGLQQDILFDSVHAVAGKKKTDFSNSPCIRYPTSIL